MENKNKSMERVKSLLGRQEVVVGIVLFLICLFLAIIKTNIFLSLVNVFNILRQSSLYAILAVGMGMVIVTTGIDLSIGSNIALSSILGAYLTRAFSLPAIGTLLVIFTTGALIGLINGTLVAYAGIPAFIVTLGMKSVASGIALLISKGAPISYEANWLSVFGGGYIGPIPVSVLVMVVIVAMGVLFAGNTLIGRNIFAVGNSARAAKLSGINVEKTQVLVFVINGLLCAVCAIILIGQMNSADPSFGSGYEMDAVAAAVIGGISMSGGEGRIGGTLIGALLMAVLRNMFVLLAVSGYWQTIILGCVIILSVAVDCIRKKRQSA